MPSQRPSPVCARKHQRGEREHEPITAALFSPNTTMRSESLVSRR